MDDDEICTPRKLDPSKEVKEPHNGSQTHNNQMKIQRKKRKTTPNPINSRRALEQGFWPLSLEAVS
jgi:hypothetical protein